MSESGPAPRPGWDLPPRRANRLALLCLVLITLTMPAKIFTGDYGTHLAIGRHIVQDREIPVRELWNYPSLGQRIDLPGSEWGFEVLLYLVHAAGGEYGVSLLIWALVLGIFCLLYRSAVLRGAHPFLAVLALFAYSGFLRFRLQPRPEVFSYLFTALTIRLLAEYYFGKRTRWIYAFPPLVLVWANFHPAFLMGFALGAAFFLDALARAAWRRELRWRNLRSWVLPPLLVALLGMAACGANPNGYRWLLEPLHLISRGSVAESTMLPQIDELKPVRDTRLFPYVKAAAAAVAVAFGLGLIGRRFSLLDLLLAALAFKGAWDYARAVSLLGLLLAPGTALSLTGFLSAAAPGGALRRLRLPSSPAALAALVVAALLAFGGATLAFSLTEVEFGMGITDHLYSFRAAEFLRKNPVPGRMFNYLGIGGFLDWQLHPETLTFTDGRTYNARVFSDHQAVVGGAPGWQRLIDGYGITHFVLKAVDSSCRVLPIFSILAGDPGWAPVFSDGLFVIFVRRTRELLGYVEAHEIGRDVLPRHVLQEAGHCAALGESSFNAHQTMADMYARMGDRRAAITSLRRALKAHEEPAVRYRLRQMEESATREEPPGIR